MLLIICAVALYGAELSDRHTISASSTSSLTTPPSSLQDVGHPSPKTRNRFTQQQQLASSASEESVSSLDKNGIFDLGGGELRLAWLQCHRLPS